MASAWGSGLLRADAALWRGGGLLRFSFVNLLSGKPPGNQNGGRLFLTRQLRGLDGVFVRECLIVEPMCDMAPGNLHFGSFAAHDWRRRFRRRIEPLNQVLFGFDIEAHDIQFSIRRIGALP